MKHDVYALVLLEVAVVLLAAWAGGWVFVKLRQPRVIGELLAGILLGPTLLGGASDTLFPAENRPFLRMLATLGVVLFMFLVGLEVDRGHLRQQARIAGAVSASGIALPFALGVALAFQLRDSYPTDDTTSFVLFIGTAMSITAFPVLVRILIDRDLDRRPLGVLAIAAAAIDDLVAWMVLAIVVSLTTSDGGFGAVTTFALGVAFVVLLVGIVGPRLRRFGNVELTPAVLSAVLIGVLACAFTTSTIGVHEIFGAFLFGLVIPRGTLATQLRERLEVVGLLLLPVFFVSTGLNVDVSAIDATQGGQLALIIGVAFAGKFGGAFLGARTQHLPPREAMAVGALMNTRGLAELIVLAVGRDLGVIDDSLFTLLVVMAVVTTVATGPLLDLLKPDPDLGGLGSARSAGSGEGSANVP